MKLCWLVRSLIDQNLRHGNDFHGIVHPIRLCIDWFLGLYDREDITWITIELVLPTSWLSVAELQLIRQLTEVNTMLSRWSRCKSEFNWNLIEFKCFNQFGETGRYYRFINFGCIIFITVTNNKYHWKINYRLHRCIYDWMAYLHCINNRMTFCRILRLKVIFTSFSYNLRLFLYTAVKITLKVLHLNRYL